ncbi:sensor histidine kinase [Prosthecobacter sp.]|uniref:sensor histidine kinase n=1 Tax=Prosthecobacter sp. TaxID=1965333 RepID=UPI002ABD0033|nr:sensor histidine kinase [Prosthecobacter sp.]MDZ4404709.1 sensor histidine kinase [Prosthecobacter sp.]
MTKPEWRMTNGFGWRLASLISSFIIASLRSTLWGSTRFAVLAVSLCSALHSSFSAELSRAIDIRTLSYERSLEKLSVELTATVGFVESGGTVFVQDDSAGTHLHFKPARNDLRVGDRVRVKGTTLAGLYFPGVDVTELEILGHESPPAAVSATYDDLAAGRFHYQRVMAEGLGRTLTPLDENRSLLRLAMGSRVIEVRLDSPPESAPSVVDARLRITALAAGGINDRRQLVFPYLRVTDWSDVEINQPTTAPESLPIISVATLLRFGAADEPHHRARIRGTVLAAFNDGRVFLRDSTPPPPPREKPKDEPPKPPQSPSIAIRLTTPVNLTPGHLAEITGFPVMTGFSASLADSLVLSAEPAELPAASLVSLKEFQDGSHDADLVQLTDPAVLNDYFRTNDGYELRLTSGSTSIRAFLLQTSAPSLEIGSSCKLTGICLVESATTDKGFRSEPDRASLLLRSINDIQVLSTAPFWDAKRLVIAITILGALVSLTLFWITQQRRQITRLERKIVQQATLEERQRIAREFHDTLEQELTGLSLRLDAATTRPLEDKARTLLETSRSLVSRIQSEARNLVSDLRDTEHATTLAEALQLLADRAPDGVAITLDITPIPPIPSPVTHHLRMIAQEAITNALKHAQATAITLHLSTTPSLLTLRIIDNGCGFAAEAETHGKPGHFGCIGIRERCRKIGAEAEWKSQPGQGTNITITLPLTS